MMDTSIKKIIENSKIVKDNFSKKFLEIYCNTGFVSMTKHDIDLLVYHLISSQTDVFENLSNHDISNLLHIQESKVKNIKLDSFLKYNEKSDKKILKEIVNLLNDGKIQPELEKDKIRFILDDPILKREFEFAVKNIGHVIDYSFNKDIINIKISTFIMVLKNKVEDGEKFEKAVIKNLKTALKKDNKLQKELEKCSTIEQCQKILSKISGVITNKAVGLTLGVMFDGLIKTMGG